MVDILLSSLTTVHYPSCLMKSKEFPKWHLLAYRDGQFAYNYTICYKKGKTLCNADALSRLPRPVTTATDDTCTELVNLVQHMSSTCVSALHIKDCTTKDPLLSKVRRFIQLGWPNNVTEVPCKPYFSRKGELSVLDGCILWGTRVVIPPPGRQPLLKELHQAHPRGYKNESTSTQLHLVA